MRPQHFANRSPAQNAPAHATAHPQQTRSQIAPRSAGPNNQALSGSIDCSDFSCGWPMQAGRPFSRNSLWVIALPPSSRGVQIMALQGLNAARHWRDRAAEMSVLSFEMKDFEARTLMSKLANDYDKLADRAEDRARHDERGPSPRARGG